MRRTTAQMIACLLWLGAFAPTTALGKSSLCLEMNGTPEEQTEALLQYAESELRRYTEVTYDPKNCTRTLHLEFIQLEKQQFWTGYLDGQVPSRYAVTSTQDSLATLSRVMTAVLRNDPAGLLEDTSQYVAAALRSDSGLQRGIMLYGVEGYQTLTLVGSEAEFLPGLGVRVRRGISNFYVGVRGGVSFGRLGRPGESPELTLVSTFEPEGGWIVTDSANTSVYLGGSVGLTIIRFEQDRSDTGYDSDTRVGLSFGARAGVEFFRQLDYRMDAFIQLNLPVFFTETNLTEGYTPSVHLGLGVAF